MDNHLELFTDTPQKDHKDIENTDKENEDTVEMTKLI